MEFTLHFLPTLITRGLRQVGRFDFRGRSWLLRGLLEKILAEPGGTGLLHLDDPLPLPELGRLRSK